jgi:hypothetical protein
MGFIQPGINLKCFSLLKIYIRYLLTLLTILFTGMLSSASSPEGPAKEFASGRIDTLKERQILYKGVVWSNIYHRFTGNQYLFSEDFLSARLAFNNHIFKDISLRYDIVSDEIMIPMGLDEIIQLNKEMVDSFTLRFGNMDYRFENIRSDSILGAAGFYNVLYEGRSSLYLKYNKMVMTVITDKSDGYFNESRHLLLLLKGKVYRITSLRDIYTLLPQDVDNIRDFIRQNKLRVRKKNPESFVQVIKYIDTLGGSTK